MSILIVHALCMRKPTPRYVCALCVEPYSEKTNGGERINVKRLFTSVFNVRAYEFIMFA